MKNSKEKGSALLGIVSVVVVAGTLVAVASRVSQTSLQGSKSEQIGTEALHLAESGLEAARYAISKSKCSTATPVFSGNIAIPGRGEYNYRYDYSTANGKPTWIITSTGYVPTMANAIGKHELKWTVDACYPECPDPAVFGNPYPSTPDILLGSNNDVGKDEGKDESKDNTKDASGDYNEREYSVTATLLPNSIVYDHVYFLPHNSHKTLNSSAVDARYDVRRMDPDSAQSTMNFVAGSYYIKTYDVGGDGTNLNFNGGTGGTELIVQGEGKVKFLSKDFYSRQHSDYNWIKPGNSGTTNNNTDDDNENEHGNGHANNNSTDDDNETEHSNSGATQTNIKVDDCNAEKAKKLTIYIYHKAWFDANNRVCGVIRGCGADAELLFENGNIEIKGGIVGVWANGSFNPNGVFDTPIRIESGFGAKDPTKPPSNTHVTTYEAAVNSEIPVDSKFVTKAKDWKATYNQ